MPAFSLSPIAPDVYTTEIDLSTVIRAVATGVGCVVGPSNKGPLEPTLMTNTKDFINYYGKPVLNNHFHYTALSFLSKGNRLYCRRTINGALYGGVEVPGLGSALDTAGIDLPGGCPEPVEDNYTWDDADAVFALFGPDPGTYNNDLGVKITHNHSQLTGTFTFTNGSATVTGVGTLFLTEVAVGDYIFPTAQSIFSLKIKSITNNTSLELESVWAGVTATGTGYLNDLQFYITLYERNGKTTTEVKKFLCSRAPLAVDGYGKSIYIGEVFEDSEYLSILDRTTLSGDDPQYMPKENTSIVWLTNGSNGSAVTPGQIMTAMDDFTNTEVYSINILMSGGWMSSGSALFTEADIEALHVHANDLVSTRKDCMAVLDGIFGKTAAQQAAWRNSNLPINSSYSAIYSGWVKIYDQYNDKRLYIPSSGYMGAVYSSTNESPAGLEVAILPVLDVEVNYSKGDRETLAEAQINPIRKHAGGIVPWDEQTMQKKLSALSSIRVRRILMTTEKAIATTLDYFLFAANTHYKRLQVTSLVEGYMDQQVANFGYYEYKAICDETNNTGVVIEQGIMVVDLYVKPVIPARFIMLNVIITRTSVSFEEVLLPAA
jgi:hypothetical protein